MRSLALLIVIGISGIFATAVAAPKETVISSFSEGGVYSPHSSLVGDPKTALYGVAGNVIYQLTPPAAGSTKWTRTTLYVTGTRPRLDGMWPGNLLLGKGGVLYGMTRTAGKTTTCCGTVFSLTPDVTHTKWTYTVIYVFQSGRDGGGTPSAYMLNLSTPSRLTVDKSGALFGSTLAGGAGATCCGTVFKLTPPTPVQSAWTKTTLHLFTGTPDGISPVGQLYIDPQGDVFGTTLYGGSNSLCHPTIVAGGCGTIFQLTPPAPGHTGWTETQITPPDSMINPFSGLISDGKGALYGTAQLTTERDDSQEWGSVFRITPPVPAHPNGTYQDIYYFAANTDGRYPEAGLTIDSQGTLYGTTFFGGINYSCSNAVGCGTVFKLAPTDSTGTNWKESIVFRFAGQNGENPTAPLLVDSSGNLYGTAPSGTGISPSGGVAFKISQ
jgi:uncharacterized repeat protein (TIGR03803 family)